MEAIREQLQDLVGTKPQVTINKYDNWSRTQTCRVYAVTPDSVEEVQSVIKAACQLKLRVRATGSGYCWSPLFPDDGNILMFMTNAQRADGEPRIQIKQDADEPAQQFITMASGVTMSEVKEVLLANSVCLPSTVSADVFQIGGLVSVACHGAGRNTQTLSDYVVRMRIVDSNGELRTYSMKDDPDMMKAVQCSLGLFGIIIDVTMKVEPMIYVENKTEWVSVESLFYNQTRLSQLLTSNDAVVMCWFPFNSLACEDALDDILNGTLECSNWNPKEDEVWINIMNKSDQTSSTANEEKYKLWDIGAWLMTKGVQMDGKFFADHPDIAPLLSRMQTQSFKDQCPEKSVIKKLPHAASFIEHLPHAPVWATEWAFELDESYQNLMKATQVVIDFVKESTAAGQFPLNIMMEVRATDHSDAYLSPAVCSDPACKQPGQTFYIAVITIAGTPGWKTFLGQLLGQWEQIPGARSHWGQTGREIDASLEGHFIKAYKDQIPRFRAALERSAADPNHMFFNGSLERIIYPYGL